MESINTLFFFFLFAIIPIHGYFVDDIGQVKRFKIEQIARTSQIKHAVKSSLAHHKAHGFLKTIVSTKKTLSKFEDSFKWRNCGHPQRDGDGLFNVTDFSMSPDPLQFPGYLYVQFNGTMKRTVDAPIEVNLKVRKEITEDFWLTIPCIEGFGSCDYDDLCEMLHGVTCPKSFVDDNVPCKCPFTKGDYNLGKTGFYINTSSIIAGKYSFTVKLTYHNRPVTCIEMFFTVAAVAQK